MDADEGIEALRLRETPLHMRSDEFRILGHQLVERIAEFLASLPERPVTPGEPTQVTRVALGRGRLPLKGTAPEIILEEASRLLFDHSLFNGHPRFWGYISASPAPIGILGEFLAAAVNQNVAAAAVAPMATEIEAQTVRWIAELIGYPTDCGGLLVSGGNMANFVGFLAARKAKVPWDVSVDGLANGGARQLRVYVSNQTHTWIQKAADVFGLGTEAIRWISVDEHLRMDMAALRTQIRADIEQGDLPLLVVGTAGSVGIGVVDPLLEIGAICREYGLWFHVDGAYGAFAAALLGGHMGELVPADLKGIAEADSVAVDPHKWLYAPLEAGCALVRSPQALLEAFSYHPSYYYLVEEQEAAPINYYEYGLQNSRGFRALKVWLGLRQVGREGYVRMISQDIRLSREMYRQVEAHPELEAVTQQLSITTFRYVPLDLPTRTDVTEAYLNQLNTALLDHLQTGGEAYVSNAVIGDKFVLRACIVNFQTSLADIERLPGIVVQLGRVLDGTMRPEAMS
jgi:aromatic-L-amino-acid/L-tryptophan decarboxylase